MFMEQVKNLIVRFKNTIDKEELPMFRGAIVNTMENANILFHNHKENGLRYAYPLIQYKRINKQAAIVCIGEGTDAIGEFFSNCQFDIHLGSREIKLEVESVKAGQTTIQLWDTSFPYYINKWMPLNQENYKQYMEQESLADKYAMLEKILVGNILSFSKSMDIHFEKQVVCKITDISLPSVIEYKGVKMTAFNAEFKTNISLPSFIGLGKGVSLGFGTITRVHKEK